MYCYNNSLLEKMRGFYLYTHCEANPDTST